MTSSVSLNALCHSNNYVRDKVESHTKFQAKFSSTNSENRRTSFWCRKQKMWFHCKEKVCIDSVWVQSFCGEFNFLQITYIIFYKYIIYEILSNNKKKSEN